MFYKMCLLIVTPCIENVIEDDDILIIMIRLILLIENVIIENVIEAHLHFIDDICNQ